MGRGVGRVDGADVVGAYEDGAGVGRGVGAGTGRGVGAGATGRGVGRGTGRGVGRGWGAGAGAGAGLGALPTPRTGAGRVAKAAQRSSVAGRIVRASCGVRATLSGRFAVRTLSEWTAIQLRAPVRAGSTA